MDSLKTVCKAFKIELCSETKFSIAEYFIMLEDYFIELDWKSLFEEIIASKNEEFFKDFIEKAIFCSSDRIQGTRLEDLSSPQRLILLEHAFYSDIDIDTLHKVLEKNDQLKEYLKQIEFGISEGNYTFNDILELNEYSLSVLINAKDGDYLKITPPISPVLYVKYTFIDLILTMELESIFNGDLNRFSYSSINIFKNSMVKQLNEIFSKFTTNPQNHIWIKQLAKELLANNESGSVINNYSIFISFIKIFKKFDSSTWQFNKAFRDLVKSLKSNPNKVKSKNEKKFKLVEKQELNEITQKKQPILKLRKEFEERLQAIKEQSDKNEKKYKLMETGELSQITEKQLKLREKRNSSKVIKNSIQQENSKSLTQDSTSFVKKSLPEEVHTEEMISVIQSHYSDHIGANNITNSISRYSDSSPESLMYSSDNHQELEHLEGC